MSVAALLQEAESVGLTVTVAGDGLRLKASSPPPQDLLDRLKRSKLAIIDWLVQNELPARAQFSNASKTHEGPVRGTPEGWRKLYHRTADEIAIRCGLTLAQALPRAFERMISEWYERHAEPTPDVCAGCGEPIGEDRAFHVFTTNDAVHLSDDLGCWLRFGRAWRARAIKGLATCGVVPPDGWDREY
jgi:hypothetical protein